MISRLHHINFLVRNLDDALPRFCKLFEAAEPPVEELDERGVRLARFQLGPTWLILVQPTDPLGFPAQHLERHGEGFFLASFQVPDVQSAAERLNQLGLACRDKTPRQGLDDWQVMDLDPENFNGIEVQLVQSESDD